MYTYDWNMITREGVFLDMQAKVTVAALQTLITNLKANNMEILGMSEEGVVIDYIDDRSIDRINEINRRLETVDFKINEIDSDVINHGTRLAILETYSIIKPPPEKDDTGEALYLMWDLIPDELKKKLTIYIKKK